MSTALSVPTHHDHLHVQNRFAVIPTPQRLEADPRRRQRPSLGRGLPRHRLGGRREPDGYGGYNSILDMAPLA